MCVLAASMFAVSERGVIQGGLVGLSISYALEGSESPPPPLHSSMDESARNFCWLKISSVYHAPFDFLTEFSNYVKKLITLTT